MFHFLFVTSPRFFANFKGRKMNTTITVKDKQFRLSITEVEIAKAVNNVATQINKDLSGQNPLFLCVLNGAFMYAADLMKQINFPCEISFVKLASYQGTSSTGKIKEMIGINECVKGRNVVVVEDIIDTGFTMQNIISSLKEKGAESIHVCTFLQKPDALQCDINVDYVAIKIPNDFIVGYGLDYDGYGRNLKEIYTVIND